MVSIMEDFLEVYLQSQLMRSGTEEETPCDILILRLRNKGLTFFFRTVLDTVHLSHRKFRILSQHKSMF